MNHSIISYFEGVQRDDKGRTIFDVLDFNDEQLEAVHDYIQWLFPLREASVINFKAPTLTDAVIAEFNARDDLKKVLLSALHRMESFYFSKDPFAHDAHWVTPHNHNYLRITRILKSVSTLGLRDEALRVYQILGDLYDWHGDTIGERTFEFWTDALSGS